MSALPGLSGHVLQSFAELVSAIWGCDCRTERWCHLWTRLGTRSPSLRSTPGPMLTSIMAALVERRPVCATPGADLGQLRDQLPEDTRTAMFFSLLLTPTRGDFVRLKPQTAPWSAEDAGPSLFPLGPGAARLG